MKIISSKITEALEFCAEAHKNQKRKSNNTPYASHPSSVGFILQSCGYKEDVVIAGILHDVIEDTTYTEKDIKERFGEKVLKMVLGVTENKKITDWHERKKDYLNKIKKSNKFVKSISASDMLDNTRSLLREIKKGGNIWQHFAVSKEENIKFFEKRFQIVKNDINEELRKELRKTLNELKRIRD